MRVEGGDIVEEILEGFLLAQACGVKGSWGETTNGDNRVVSALGHDGFFYTVLLTGITTCIAITNRPPRPIYPSTTAGE